MCCAPVPGILFFSPLHLQSPSVGTRDRSALCSSFGRKGSDKLAGVSSIRWTRIASHIPTHSFFSHSSLRRKGMPTTLCFSFPPVSVCESQRVHSIDYKSLCCSGILLLLCHSVMLFDLEENCATTGMHHRK